MTLRRCASEGGGAAATAGSPLRNPTLPDKRPLVLVSGATRTVAQLAGHPHLGCLTQPRCGNAVATLAKSGLWWAADNDALRGVQPDELLALWDRIGAADRTRLLWVTAPDAVLMTPSGPQGSWEGTRWLFRCWLPALRKRGLPPAIVAQDGASEESVPWDDINALFVGGSTAWKLSEAAASLIRAARARGKWVHVGRLNTVRRWRHFERLEIDSFDGTQFSRYAGTYLPRWLTMLELRQHTLPEVGQVGAPVSLS